MQIKFKDQLNQRELEELRGGCHGGLKFIVNADFKDQFTCYRTTLSGGLDYCNNKADQLEGEVFGVEIYKRYGLKRGQWRKVAYLERTKSTQFNH